MLTTLQNVGFALAAPIIAAIAVIVLLQVTGVIRKVPYSYSVRNIVVRWRITFMTGLAFTLVVGLMTVMLAFVNGMYKLTESSGVPGNVVVLADGSLDELFSNLGYGDIKEMELNPLIVRDDDNKPLASWEVYVVVNQPIAVRKCPVCGELAPVDRFGQKLAAHGDPECSGSGSTVVGTRGRRFLQVRGIEDPARSGAVHGLALYEGGRWFNQAGVEPVPGSKGEIAIQAVIGEGLARELGPDQGKKALAVGDYFELGPRKWIVVGIMKSSGSTFDSEVWSKFQIVGEQFGKRAYTTCVVRAADKASAVELAKDLSDNYKKPAVTATIEEEYYSRMNTTNVQFLYAILIVVAIMAVGGVFGIMNTMFAAISQRTKDIGVLRILGFAPWQVLLSFFFEAVLLALIGGAVGCAVGLLSDGWTASSIMSSGPRRRRTTRARARRWPQEGKHERRRDARARRERAQPSQVGHGKEGQQGERDEGEAA